MCAYMYVWMCARVHIMLWSVWWFDGWCYNSSCFLVLGVCVCVCVFSSAENATILFFFFHQNKCDSFFVLALYAANQMLFCYWEF